MADCAGTSPGGLMAISNRISALSGWRRTLVAGLAGAVAASGLPPYHFVPLLLPAFTTLLWLIDGTTRLRSAILVGWAFGFGYFLVGVHWVGEAFLVDAARFGWVMPIAIAGLAALLAIFQAIAAVLVSWSGWRGPSRIFLFAGAWLFGEWLRSWVFSGFPWNLIGTVWDFSLEIMQFGAILGVWGLSVMTVLAALSPAVLVSTWPQGSVRGRRVLTTMLIMLPAALWAGGAWRLSTVPEVGARTVPGVILRLVQPSIDQREKWEADLRQQHVVRQMRMSAEPPEGVTHVIWAETAVPFLLSDEPDLRRVLSQVVPPDGLLLTGAPRRGSSATEMKVWNSLFALDPSGETVAAYDKFHLVPFGEYVPFRAILGPLKLTVGDTDFAAGPGPRTLSLPGLPPVSPLICYEVIFPGAVVAGQEGPRPEWLLNLTNDAWFGTSSGPRQHFANARLRALEEGLPLVRVANSGISAVVDGYGRVLGEIGLNAVGTLDLPLPRAITGRTAFSVIGNTAVAILVALTFLSGYWLWRRERASGT